MNGVETVIVNGLTGLLSVAVTGLIGYLSAKLKRLFDSHVNANEAKMFNQVMTGLGRIAETTVQDFNQRIVADAKSQGVFTPALAQRVKSDAMAAVKSQGSSLITLGGQAFTDVDAMVSALIEQAIAKQKVGEPGKGAHAGTAISDQRGA